jgi:YkoP-like protein
MAVWDSAEPEPHSRHSHPWLAEILYALDRRLQQRHAVFEYSHHPACIFRLEIAASPRPVMLRDGTVARAGQRLARLHFWNEHIPPFPRTGATIAWARRMQQAIAISLRELAHYLASRPDLNDIAVIHGDVPSGTRTQTEKLARIMAHYGFETVAEPDDLPIGQRLHRLAENILISLIILAHNAGALRLDTLNRVRLPIYFSRRLLNEKFGDAGEQPSFAEVA